MKNFSNPPAPMDIIVVAGMSGAGKTVAIKALEDCGYYPLDHLPADTLSLVLASLADKGKTKIAIGLDVWDPHFLEGSDKSWTRQFAGYGDPRLLLLEASDAELVRRYGETRRRHPLTENGSSLADAIAKERRIMDRHGAQGHRIDTTDMNPNTLKAYIKSTLDLKTSHMDICIESFGFKHGAPTTCDLIFDVRCLPNPYYEKSLRSLSGLDQPVRDFFLKAQKPEKMARQIAQFVTEWKEDYEGDHRSYLTVGVGCTGGQHRSVFVAETIRSLLSDMNIQTRCRHREQQRWGSSHGTAPVAPHSKANPKL
jgi:UPF0042 nucleotide-binding protein